MARLAISGKRGLDLLVDEAVLAERRASFEPLPPRYTRGVLHKYAKLVGSASRGAVPFIGRLVKLSPSRVKNNSGESEAMAQSPVSR